MTEIKIRNLTQSQVDELTYRANVKKFKSRESYIRHLIEKDLNEEIANKSHHKYVQLCETLLEYQKATDTVIKQNESVLLHLIAQSELKKQAL